MGVTLKWRSHRSRGRIEMEITSKQGSNKDVPVSRRQHHPSCSTLIPLHSQSRKVIRLSGSRIFPRKFPSEQFLINTTQRAVFPFDTREGIHLSRSKRFLTVVPQIVFCQIFYLASLPARNLRGNAHVRVPSKARTVLHPYALDSQTCCTAQCQEQNRTAETVPKSHATRKALIMTWYASSKLGGRLPNVPLALSSSNSDSHICRSCKRDQS